jgi:adenylosuccinate lyase
MTGWSFGSKVYGGAWTTPQMQALFADASRTRRWLNLLAILAETQAEFDLIPKEAARDILATAQAIMVDEEFLRECREGYEATGHSTAGLIRAFARRCAGPGAEWFYVGATVQDIADTWLMLTLREARGLMIADLDRAAAAAEELCRRHRNTLMPGRTHGQQGLPITFGFKAAGWLAELRRCRQRFEEAAPRLDVGQLCGGVGSLSALGPEALALQRRFFERIGLRAPDISWTASRDILVEWGSLSIFAAGAADRIGHEVYNLQRDEIGELREGASRENIGSITMPHKRNPEAAEHLGTLSRAVRANAALLCESLVHDHERDGRSWKIEWHAVPEITLAAGKALALLAGLLEGLEVRPERMCANLDAADGYPLSEGIMLALARKIGKQSAHKLVHDLLTEARSSGRSLRDAVMNDHDIRAHLSQSELEALLDPLAQIGQCQALVDRVLVARSDGGT